MTDMNVTMIRRLIESKSASIQSLTIQGKCKSKAGLITATNRLKHQQSTSHTRGIRDKQEGGDCLRIYAPNHGALKVLSNIPSLHLHRLQLHYTYCTQTMPYAEELRRLLTRRIAVPRVSTEAFTQKPVWCIGRTTEDSVRVQLSQAASHQNGGMIHLKLALNREALLEESLDLNVLAESGAAGIGARYIWLVAISKQEVGRLIREQKGMPLADASTYRRTFNREYGESLYTGQLLIHQEALREGIENRSDILFGKGKERP